jgi:hypothetical protein
MVIAPARTGRLTINNREVIKTDQMKRGSFLKVNLELKRLPMIVHIKLILLIIEEIPARCKEKIARSTETPE